MLGAVDRRMARDSDGANRPSRPTAVSIWKKRKGRVRQGTLRVPHRTTISPDTPPAHSACLGIEGTAVRSDRDDSPGFCDDWSIGIHDSEVAAVIPRTSSPPWAAMMGCDEWGAKFGEDDCMVMREGKETALVVARGVIGDVLVEGAMVG